MGLTVVAQMLGFQRITLFRHFPKAPESHHPDLKKKKVRCGVFIIAFASSSFSAFFHFRAAKCPIEDLHAVKQAYRKLLTKYT